MAITAALIKQLREKTGAGMMDCKKALTENDGDEQAAIDWLRAKGIAASEKKASRIAAEGLIGMATGDKSGAVAEVNSETDFVARNDAFQDMVRNVATVALAENGDLEKTLAATYPGGSISVEEFVKEMVGTIGENMNVRRTRALSVSQGVVSAYMHNTIADGVGKIGVLVALESSGDPEKLDAFGRKLAMHIAAINPLALSQDDLDPEIVEKERQVLTDQARESGKPDNIIEKMIEGRIRKFYSEVCLLAQTFVHDTDLTVEKAVKAAADEIGSPIKIVAFERMALGEGLEKREEDFAAEVAAAAGGDS